MVKSMGSDSYAETEMMLRFLSLENRCAAAIPTWLEALEGPATGAADDLLELVERRFEARDVVVRFSVLGHVGPRHERPLV